MTQPQITSEQISMDLDGLSDTNVSAAIDGDSLFWNNTSSMWEPSAISLAFDDLTDLSVTTPTDGDTIFWNNTSSMWESGAISLALDDLTDLNVATPNDGDRLVWNNTSSMWEPVAPSTLTVYYIEITAAGVGTVLPAGWSIIANGSGGYEVTHNLGTDQMGFALLTNDGVNWVPDISFSVIGTNLFDMFTSVAQDIKGTVTVP